MTRRRLLFGLLLASAMLACFAGWLLIGRRVSQARFEQVKIGMSREEVIRTVGGPPGDHSNGECVSLCGLGTFRDKGYESWRGDDGELFVRFDDAGTATNVVIQDVFGPPTLTERIRRWLGL
jgi:hypothetical protein